MQAAASELKERGHFIAGDWGSSRLRLFLCRRGDDASLSVLERLSGPGIAGLQVTPSAALFPLIGDWVLRFGKLPIAMSGMVGSDLGWVNTPYLDCPVGIPHVRHGRIAFLADGHEITITPGIRCINPLGSPDIMRGEETQIAGWMSQDRAYQAGSFLLCLPGTHTKWVLVRDGCIRTFWTSITGEVYALLENQSGLITHKDSNFNDEVFVTGCQVVNHAGPNALLTALFGVRSRQICGDLDPADARAYLSGNLVGADVQAAVEISRKLEVQIESVVLIGATLLTHLFSLAIERTGLHCEIGGADEIFLNAIEPICQQSRRLSDSE